MSKSNSGLFSGTNGDKLTRYTRTVGNLRQKIPESDIIASRVAGLDLHEHPLKYKQLSSKKMKQLSKKVATRTLTQHEYKSYDSNMRLLKRREKGVDSFWKQETQRIIAGAPTTRNWSPEQRNDIIHNRRPKENGKTLQGHHTYSVAKYPHLANRGEVVFPATFNEHLYGWHGGNFKKSLPGQPINPSKLRR